MNPPMMSEAPHLNFVSLWLTLQSTHVPLGESFKIQTRTGCKQNRRTALLEFSLGSSPTDVFTLECKLYEHGFLIFYFTSL